jgi:hypothetical protein
MPTGASFTCRQSGARNGATAACPWAWSQATTWRRTAELKASPKLRVRAQSRAGRSPSARWACRVGFVMGRTQTATAAAPGRSSRGVRWKGPTTSGAR